MQRVDLLLHGLQRLIIGGCGRLLTFPLILRGNHCRTPQELSWFCSCVREALRLNGVMEVGLNNQIIESEIDNMVLKSEQNLVGICKNENRRFLKL